MLDGIASYAYIRKFSSKQILTQGGKTKSMKKLNPHKRKMYN
jgi:hypothetical protein